jgi:23S rRNA pseudouridine2605 synthase
MPEPERLQKALAAAGLGSRRKCEEMIETGRVTVNGEIATIGDRVDIDTDKVAVNGISIDLKTEKKYYLLNKPAGFITTVRDTRGRPTVMHLIKEKERLFPVGRLDKNTRGLLLITNDGYLAQKMTHPSHGIEKTYLVQVQGNLTSQWLQKLRKGVVLEEGKTMPARVRVLRQAADRALLEITIHEGKKRQIRRMLAALGLEVLDLMRTKVGPLTLHGLEEGSYRSLTPEEIRKLLS